MNSFFLKTLLLSILYSTPIIAMLSIPSNKNKNAIPSLEHLPLEMIQHIDSTLRPIEKLTYRLKHRLICKTLAELDNTPHILYDTYNKDKYISPACAFLDCVQKNKIKEVEWFQTNELYQQLDFLTNCYHQNYVSLSPLVIAEENKNTPMINLLNRYFKPAKEKNRIFNYNLCLTSCIGDINGFEKELSIDTGNQANTNSIPLVIWAATKNGDIDFLKNLLKHEDYKLYMERNSDKFLRFAFVGFSFESFFGHQFAKDLTTTPNLERIKKLIDSKCFKLSKKNYDCQSSWDNHAVGYLDNIKDINPIFTKMHTYALQLLLIELHEKGMKTLRNRLLIGGGLLALIGGTCYYFQSDK